jgi:predicted DsbA family dithiol-disulfide isomerase
MATLMAVLEIDVWSDVVCPWCYVGKRNLEAAVEAFAHRDEVSVRWRSFELDPAAPPVRVGSLVDHLAAKYGMTREEALKRQAELVEVGARVGLDFDFDRARSGNTFNAHRLIHLAGEHGLGGEAKERLLHAYFSEGEAIGEVPVLERLGGEIGLPAEEVSELFAGDRLVMEVRADEELAGALGIQAVPCFAVARRFAVSGAQPPEVLGQLLQRGWDAQMAAAATPG